MATAVLLLVACSKEEKVQKEESGGLSDLISSTKDYSKMSSSMEEVTKNIEKLKNVEPLTNDQLKAFLPEQLLGLKRTELSVGDNSMMNLSTAESKYSDGDKKEIKLEIIDGAGETGSTMVSIMMMGLTGNQEKITENGFEKSAEINGVKSIISEDRDGENVNSKIQTVAKNRYLMTLNAEGFSSEELKKALAEMNMSELK